MKRLLLLTAFFSITSVSFAQLNKGQFLVGGNASFSHSETDIKNNSTIIQLSPNVGYFVTDRLVAGARGSLSRHDGNIEAVNYAESRIDQVSISPFIRYYFLPKTQKLNLFADAGYSYGWYKSTSKSIPGSSAYDYTIKSNTQGYFISAGPAIFITPNTLVEFTFTHNYSKRKHSSDRNKNFLVGVGFQINL